MYRLIDYKNFNFDQWILEVKMFISILKTLQKVLIGDSQNYLIGFNGATQNWWSISVQT